jgi:hypothetical protein
MHNTTFATIIASILISVALALGMVYWIDWINRVRIRWNMRREQNNQTHKDWEFVKWILRRHR